MSTTPYRLVYGKVKPPLHIKLAMPDWTADDERRLEDYRLGRRSELCNSEGRPGGHPA